MVNLAHNLEAEVLKKPTGTQDYFPAIEPGLNIIHYTPAGERLERLPLPAGYFNERMVLVYTGQPHHSGLNNWQVIKAVIDGDEATLAALNEIKKVGDQVADACRSGRWESLAELFDAEFAARVKLSPGFTSDRIQLLKELVRSKGAVKICGAGGGGCVMIWCDPAQRTAVTELCRENGYEILEAHPVGG